MDDNLRVAKSYLNKVGGSLMSEMKNDPSKATRIKEVLSILKKANKQINSIESSGDFSFDALEENAGGKTQAQMRESSSPSMGVDLGDFDAMISAPPTNNEWRSIFKEANKSGGVDLTGVDLSQDAYADTLGRIVDNT